MLPDIAVVFGTYNRLTLLRRCISSVRRSAGHYSVRFCIADGGSTDGTLEWLRQEGDVDLIEQGELLGAVRAFNAGYARAVDLGAPYVVTFNDDIAFVGPEHELERSVQLLEVMPQLGAVAFESDRYGEWRFERYHGLPYMNQGITRRAVGMAVARAQGDPDGKAWWDPRFHTYASDTIFGLWIWRLGWQIHEGRGWRVTEDYNTPAGKHDPLRERNANLYTNADIFHRQWGNPNSVLYNQDDAMRFGGRV